MAHDDYCKKMKNISIIGIGKLGICLTLMLEKAGYNVLGMDINKKYVELINNKTLQSSEPNVMSLLKKSKNFRATTDINEAFKHSNTIFIVVPTPSLDSGSYDHQYIEKIFKNISQPFKTRKHFIICCTVMPGYSDELAEKVKLLNCVISYNPEFIAQGTIIKDHTYPDVVLIGEADKKAGDEIKSIYSKICKNKPPIHRMSRISAEITKIALNCFITTKIAYANMVGDVALSAGAEVDKILNCIGSDKRVGHNSLKYGFGFGGPCFPRDNRAFGKVAQKHNVLSSISKATDLSNKFHLKYQIENFLKSNPNIKKTTITSVSYKKNVPILEESQPLEFALELSKKGIKVTIEDNPEIIEMVKNKYGKQFKYKIRNENI